MLELVRTGTIAISRGESLRSSFEVFYGKQWPRRKLPSKEPPPNGDQKGIYILPSLFTTGSLFADFYSIVRSLNSDWVSAAWAIMFAGIFDGLDGRIAKLTKTQTEFGLEYEFARGSGEFRARPRDSGLHLEPAFPEPVRVGRRVLIFACGALRLARFNVQATSVEKRYFQGLPIPAAAYALAKLRDLPRALERRYRMDALFLMPFTITLALLMVSEHPLPGDQAYRFSKPRSFVVLVAIAIVLFR